jgi:alkylhydroperoxidase family enzyme
VAERLDVARLEPVPRAEWTAEFYDAMKAMTSSAPPRPQPPPPPAEGQQARGSNVLGLFANHPALAKAYFTFNGHILYGSSIGGRQRELVILRVAAVRRAEYEWAQHVQIGREEGLTDDEIERIITGATAGGWSPFDAALLAAVDELLASARISDATWSVLAAEFDRHQLIDLVFTIGAYELLAMAFNSFQLQAEESLKLVTPRLDTHGGAP